MSIKIEVYFVPGFDEANDAMIAAESPEAAARALPFSIYQLQRMGWRVLPPDTADATLAASLVGHVFYRPRRANALIDWRLLKWTNEEFRDVERERFAIAWPPS